MTNDVLNQAIEFATDYGFDKTPSHQFLPAYEKALNIVKGLDNLELSILTLMLMHKEY